MYFAKKSQIQKKERERNELVKMASSAASDLHAFIKQSNLSMDLHLSLDKLMSQHLECPNCRLIEEKYEKILKRQRKKYGKRRKKFRGRKLSKICDNECRSKVFLNERICDLKMDELFLKESEQNMNLMEVYSGENDVKIGNGALIRAKIESNLLFYYQV